MSLMDHQKVENTKKNSKMPPNDKNTLSRLKDIGILKESLMGWKGQEHPLADQKLLRKFPRELKSSTNSQRVTK